MEKGQDMVNMRGPKAEDKANTEGWNATGLASDCPYYQSGHHLQFYGTSCRGRCSDPLISILPERSQVLWAETL